MASAVKADLAWQTVGTACNALVSFALLAWLARLLGPESFGHYIALLSVAVVLLVPIEGGWPSRLYRDGAGRDALESQGLAAGGLAHIVAAGMSLAVLGAPFASSAGGWMAAMLCMTAVAAMNLVSARMRSGGQFQLEAGWQVAGRLLSAGLIVASVLAAFSSPTAIFLAWGAGLGIVLMFGARQWLAWPRWRGLRQALPLTLPFLLVEGMLALLMKGDVAILGAWGARGESLAFYAACTRLNEAALLLVAPIGNVLLRSLRLNRDSPRAFSRLWERAALGTVIAGSAAVAGALLGGNWLMPLLFGAAYAQAGALLPFTAAMLPFALSTAVLAVALLARGDERWLGGCLMLGALALAAAMGLGWQWRGAEGAALSAAASHALVWTACLWRLRRRLPATAPAAAGS